MSEIIDIFQEYKNKNINVYLSVRTLSKKLGVNRRKTFKMIESIPEIKKKTNCNVHNSGFMDRYLYYLE